MLGTMAAQSLLEGRCAPTAAVSSYSTIVREQQPPPHRHSMHGLAARRAWPEGLETQAARKCLSRPPFVFRIGMPAPLKAASRIGRKSRMSTSVSCDHQLMPAHCLLSLFYITCVHIS